MAEVIQGNLNVELLLSHSVEKQCGYSLTICSTFFSKKKEKKHNTFYWCFSRIS